MTDSPIHLPPQYALGTMLAKETLDSIPEGHERAQPLFYTKLAHFYWDPDAPRKDPRSEQDSLNTDPLNADALNRDALNKDGLNRDPAEDLAAKIAAKGAMVGPNRYVLAVATKGV